MNLDKRSCMYSISYKNVKSHHLRGDLTTALEAWAYQFGLDSQVSG